MDAEYLHGFYLGDLFVEPLTGRVSGRDHTTHLPPKAAEVLVCLARHAGQFVSHEDLFECGWGTRNVSHDALSHTIGEIRHALDDQADDPKYIQTLPRIGYRLIVNPVPYDDHSDSIILGNNGNAALGLFESLRQRGVIETAIAYLFFGWLFIQVADIVFDRLRLPEWSATFVTVLVIVGFPIAVVLSWFLEFRGGKAVLDHLSPRDARRQRFSRMYLSIVSAMAAAAVLVWVFKLFDVLPGTDAEAIESSDLVPVKENSIAVLPFLNNDGSEETQVFANGLVDDVLTQLSKVPGLLVASRGDSSSLPPNTPSHRVRQRLRVAMYLEGSVEMHDDEIRVIVQLIDSANGFHILSQSFSRPRKNFFALRDEVTALTVSSLRSALPVGLEKIALETVASRPQESPTLDAYVLYRRGVDELSKPTSQITLASAQAWFDAALAVEPDYAAAYAGKCQAFTLELRETSETSLATQAEAACDTALDIDPNLDVVYIALGGLYVSSGRYDEAERAYEQALGIDARSVDAMTGLSEVYMRQKRPGKAEQILYDAIGLQPGNWRIYSNLGAFFYRQGRYAEAADQFRAVISMVPDNARALSNLASAYMLDGDFAASLSTYKLALQFTPDRLTYTNLGLVNYYLGDYEAAEAAVRQAIALVPEHYLSWTSLGDILYVAGKQEEALEAYRTAEKLLNDLMVVNPNDPGYLMDHAWIHAALGQEDVALAEVSAAADAAPDDPYTDYFECLVYHRFGHDDAALYALERAVNKGLSTTLLAAEPLLRKLRSDPRFVKITNPDKGREQ